MLKNTFKILISVFTIPERDMRCHSFHLYEKLNFIVENVSTSFWHLQGISILSYFTKNLLQRIKKKLQEKI